MDMNIGENGLSAYDATDSPEGSEHPLPPSVVKHTQFLDLTNGQGGKGSSIAQQQRQQQQQQLSYVNQAPASDFRSSSSALRHHPVNLDDIEDIMAAANDDQRMAPGADLPPPPSSPDTLLAAAAASTARIKRGGGMRIDPNTPGKVVQPGQEHTGRWTREEHEAFLSALQMYGKEWKKVAAKVKTRTVVQTRTHAQKYFQKLQKVMSGADGVKGVGSVDHGLAVDMGVSSDTKSQKQSIASSQRKKRRQSAASAQAQAQAQAAQTAQQQAQQAAHLMTNLSAAATTPPAPTPPTASSTTAKRGGQQQFQTPSLGFLPSASVTQDTPLRPPNDLYSTTGGTPAPTAYFPRSTPSSAVEAASQVRSSAGRGGWGGSIGAGSSMKINAPHPDAAARRGKFPEPSPAACGKRKLAEIAAAQMLAGVMASGGSTNSSATALAPDLSFLTKPSPTLSKTLEMEEEAAQPDGVASADGAVTPPPPPMEIKSGEEMDTMPRGNILSSLSAGPAPPMSNNKVDRPPQMMKALQIVNPETLGVSNQSKRGGRGLDGGQSPTTPWDGQLEALVSESKKDNAIGSSSTTTAEEANGSKSSMANTSSAFPHPVCGPGSLYNRSELHQAVCQMDEVSVRNLLSAGSSKLACSESDEAGYYPIHTAASLRMAHCPHSVATEITRLLLSSGSGTDVSCTDGNGNTPLHWAARAGDEDVTNLLLMKNCPPDVQNKFGETPLHWAMRAGKAGIGVVRVLLENGGARASMFNRSFKRPLDVAADGFLEESISDTDGNSLSSRNNSASDLTKLFDTNGKGGKKLTKAEQRRLQSELTNEKRETRANLLLLSAQSRTLVLHHPECLEHTPKSESDWEVPDRVNSIMKRIAPASREASILPHEVTISSEFDRAKIELLSRIHSAEYLAFVNDLSKDLERKRGKTLSENGDGGSPGASNADGDSSGGTSSMPPHHVVPFTPMVQKSVMKEEIVKIGDHSDTSFSSGSLRAARRAAGAVQQAVDRVLVGRNRNAFCVVRPPGHHAGIQGLLAGGESCGFCIFNSVAAGALHAISDERLMCERCAIVDIDVHHGNGTEEIVKKFHDPGRLLFFSIHLYDNEKRKGNLYKFYPGTGDEDDVARNIINVPIAPLWKERSRSSNEASSSSEVPVTRHSTRRKAKERAAAAGSSRDSPTGGASTSSSVDSGGIPALPLVEEKYSDAESDPTLRTANTGSTAKKSSKNTAASPRPSMDSGRVAYRQAIQHRLIPALRAFNPDLILISAGFDGAKGDVGNAKHMIGVKERMGLDLTPEDYAWTTRKVVEVADICCQGRVVSVLEGGYGRTPAPTTGEDESNNQSLDKTGFTECAVRHLHAMIDPYNVESRYPST